MSQLIKLDAAAKLLTVSRRTLDRLIDAGELEKTQVSPRRYAIEENQIERYITQKKVCQSPMKSAQVVTLYASEDEACKRLAERLSARPTQKRSTQKR